MFVSRKGWLGAAPLDVLGWRKMARQTCIFLSLVQDCTSSGRTECVWRFLKAVPYLVGTFSGSTIRQNLTGDVNPASQNIYFLLLLMCELILLFNGFFSIAATEQMICTDLTFSHWNCCFVWPDANAQY